MSNWPITKLKDKLFVKHGFPFKGEFFSDDPTDYIHEKGDIIVAMTEQATGLLGSCARIPES